MQDTIQSQTTLSIEHIILELWAMQRTFYGIMWPKDTDTYTHKYVAYIQGELAEVMQETNFKDHKAKRPIDMEKLGEEIVDVIIYALDLGGVAFNSPEELLEAVAKKVQYNKSRQDWDVNRRQHVPSE